MPPGSALFCCCELWEVFDHKFLITLDIELIRFLFVPAMVICIVHGIYPFLKYTLILIETV